MNVLPGWRRPDPNRSLSRRLRPTAKPCLSRRGGAGIPCLLIELAYALMDRRVRAGLKRGPLNARRAWNAWTLGGASKVRRGMSGADGSGVMDGGETERRLSGGHGMARGSLSSGHLATAKASAMRLRHAAVAVATSWPDPLSRAIRIGERAIAISASRSRQALPRR